MEVKEKDVNEEGVVDRPVCPGCKTLMVKQTRKIKNAWEVKVWVCPAQKTIHCI